MIAAAGALALASVASPGAYQPMLEAVSEYGWQINLAASDDFAGASLSAKWKQQLGDWIGTPPAAFVDDNAQVGGDELTLSTVSAPGFKPAGQADDCDCGFKDMTTGMVVSATQLQYGFFEVRAKFASASLLSSFWLQGAGSEINVLDAVPASAVAGGAQKLSTNYHCFTAGGDPDAVENSAAGLDLSASGFDATQYHVYGIDWSADRVIYYVDGRPVRTLRRSELATDGCLAEPMNVVLSVETTEAEGVPTGDFRHSTAIDYFRHWSRTAKATPSPTANPTARPTANPTARPTADPTARPTADPTARPTADPTARPTADPTARPTADPTDAPVTTPPPTNAPATDQSLRTCGELGWQFRYGNKEVCGRSKNAAGQCINNLLHSAAADACAAGHGARLCTTTELNADATRGTGCGHDNRLVWTADACTTDAGEAGFVARRGRSGTKASVGPPQCLPLNSNSAALRCCADVAGSAPPPPPSPQKSCTELGWPFRHGNNEVCGHSNRGFGDNGASACLSGRTHSFAAGTCSSVGARLCTAAELNADATRGTGCGHDNRLVWTADACTTDAGEAGFVARRGRSGTKASVGPPQCLAPTATATDSDSDVAIRCCSDKDVAIPSRGSVGEMADSKAGNVNDVFRVGIETDEDLLAMYDQEGEAAAYRAQTARLAMLSADAYDEDDSSASGTGGGSDSGAGGSHSAAAGVATALAACVLLVGALVVKKQQQQRQDDRAGVESGGARARRSSAGAEFEAASAAVTTLTPPADYREQAEPVATLPAAPEGDAVYKVPAEPFDPNGFAYDDAGSLRLQSVRRANPAYTQSVYSMADVVGPAGVEGNTVA